MLVTMPTTIAIGRAIGKTATASRRPIASAMIGEIDGTEISFLATIGGVVDTVETTGTSGATMAVATGIRTIGGAGPMARDSARGSYSVGRSHTTGPTVQANTSTPTTAR